MAQNLDFEDIIKFIFVVVILIPFLGVMFGLIGSLNQKCPECPICDCSSYQNNLTNCTDELSNRPIINNTVYVNVTSPPEIQEVIVKQDSAISIILLSISSISFFSLFLLLKFKIKLFDLNINLPEEMKNHLKKYEKPIKFIKLGSLIISILIFIRLVWILISLF